MIGLILGTSEGKNILSMLNEYTEDIFITTATEYGGELLKDYKYRVMNTTPLDKASLKEKLIDNKVTILVDATHPYAVEITKNAEEVCKELKINYVRYERPSISKLYSDYDNLIPIKSLEEFKDKVRSMEGTILNTTGSRNVEKFVNFNIKNRIIHRVLPTTESVEKCISSGVKVEDIIAIKGPISKELDKAFIKEYNVKIVVMKDSGIQGGTKEKIEAVIESGIKAFIIERNNNQYDNCFHSEEQVVEFIKDKLNLVKK